MNIDKLVSSTWIKETKHAIISTDLDKSGNGYNENADHRQELKNKFGASVHYTIGNLTNNINDLRSIRLLKNGKIVVRY